MPLEDHFAGNEAFENYSSCFKEQWENFNAKEELLALVGNDLILARPIAYHLQENFHSWFNRKIPALENLTPAECMKSPKGILRLKSCLHRMP